MTVPRWDADRQLRRFPGEPDPRPARAPGGRKRKVAWAALAALMVIAVAVSATQMAQEDRRIGLCHHTGSETNPYVFQVVKEDGYEHGHHRHHEGDFFVTDLSRGCVSDELAPAPGNETPEEPAGNETPDDPEDPTGNETPEEPTGNDTPEEPSGNETPDEPAGNETPEEPTGNETPEEPSGNETPPDNATEPEPAGDAAVRQTAVQDDFAVALTLRVTSLGPGVAHDVALDDQLPDVRRSWQLAGADAGSCVLDGRSLSCWFGDLPAGEERVVEVHSFTDRMPCGFALTNTAYVTATGDAEARNDASSASIAARSC